MIFRTLQISIQEIKVLFADRQALAILFLMPVLLILFLSLALTDIYHQKVGRHFQVVLLAHSKKIPEILHAKMKGYGYEILVDSAESQSIEEYVQLHDPEVVLELPQDLEALLEKRKDSVSTEKIKISFRPNLDQSYQDLIKAQLTLIFQSMVIDRVNEEILGSSDLGPGDPSAGKSVALRSFDHQTQLFEVVGKTKVLPNPLQQTVPAWSLFAMFFIVIPLSNSFIRDRKLGMFKRLLGYNVSKGELILGKVAPYIVINCLQLFAMYGVGRFVMPWLTDRGFVVHGDLGPLLIVTLVSSLAATSFGLLIASWARTAEQATSLGPLLVVIMALTGGVMIPHFVMPQFMQKLAHLSPLYWGLESYFDVFLYHTPVKAMLYNIAFLFGFALITFLLAIYRFRWNDDDGG